MKINKIDIIDMIEQTKKKLESIPLETNKGTKAVKENIMKNKQLLEMNLLYQKLKNIQNIKKYYLRKFLSA